MQMSGSVRATLRASPAGYRSSLQGMVTLAPTIAEKRWVDGIGMRGSRDYQVTDEDVVAWRNGLAGTSGVEIQTIPDLNHLFIAGTGKPGPSEYGTPGHVDVRVIDKLAAFIASTKAD